MALSLSGLTHQHMEIIYTGCIELEAVAYVYTFGAVLLTYLTVLFTYVTVNSDNYNFKVMLKKFLFKSGQLIFPIPAIVSQAV